MKITLEQKPFKKTVPYDPPFDTYSLKVNGEWHQLKGNVEQLAELNTGDEIEYLEIQRQGKDGKIYTDWKIISEKPLSTLKQAGQAEVKAQDNDKLLRIEEINNDILKLLRKLDKDFQHSLNPFEPEDGTPDEDLPF